ncbi:hypothetical protein Pla175_38670 [Pirellulimonas nuda]|uniref:Uncharacterized protein n=1 Tax=Pirellulimonas nuda TaxID=2528009 RepID=A0A518DGA5_9BACT|nr:nuclear transport factor 2 family protein [Pirellulimonas nuda]QDU90462.1 hypothetical protein Pla175_38670 [Pirellulimonas nuda]
MQSAEGTDSAAPSEPLTVALRCPDCNAPGVVEWRKLQHGLKCHGCGCEFMIAKGGDVISLREQPQTRYTCPRCCRSGSIAAILAVNKPCCPSCKLPLVRGPDGRLHSAQTAERLKRQAAQQAGLQRRLESERKATRDDGQLRTRIAQTARIGAAALVLIVGISAAWSHRASTPEARAAQFIRTCLAADWEDAGEFIEDDAVQRVEFDRWRVRYFSSILDRHRPAGDRVVIRVDRLTDDPTQVLLRVTLRSHFFGERSHQQCWHIRDGRWTFNALGTLADGNSSRGTGGKGEG